jgi:GNAT superfamily N-acetyltransferase
MLDYAIRRATLDDLDVLVRHRIRMFEDMGRVVAPEADADRLASEYRAWLTERMPSGVYVSWVVDAVLASGGRQVVSGGGATVIPWPPGPFYPGSRLAYVYNVYTEPEHRGRGLARMVMEAIHDFCRAEKIGSVALNASTFGQSLYESMGYRMALSPMMFLSLPPDSGV